jgi:hypothetical protein
MRPRSLLSWTVCSLVGVVLAITAGCDAYGTRLWFNGGELYYTSNVSKDQAEKVGNFLVKKGVFNGERKTAQLDRGPGDAFTLRIVVKKEFQNKDGVRDDLKQLCTEVSREVFDGAAVDGWVCDEHLNSVGDPVKVAAEKKS